MMLVLYNGAIRPANPKQRVLCKVVNPVAKLKVDDVVVDSQAPTIININPPY